MRGRCVGPCVIEGTKARALVGDGGQRVQKVAGRARQPVEARDRQHVAFFKLVDDAAQLHAVGLGSARRLAEHAHGSGGLQRRHLSVERLPVRADPRIAENRHAAGSQTRLTFASIFCIAQALEKPRARQLFKSLEFYTICGAH